MTTRAKYVRFNGTGSDGKRQAIATSQGRVMARSASSIEVATQALAKEQFLAELHQWLRY